MAERIILNQALRPTTLSKLIDPNYLWLLCSFTVYLDIYLAWFENTNLLSLTYKWGDALPFGEALILLSVFGTLGFFIPSLFGMFRDVYHEIRFDWEKEHDKYEFLKIADLEERALVQNNSVALAIAHHRRNLSREHSYETHLQLLLGSWLAFYLLLSSGFYSLPTVLNGLSSPIPNRIIGAIAFLLLVIAFRKQSAFGIYVPRKETKHGKQAK